MKKSIDEFKKSVQGKKIAVLGIGISNTPLIKYLSCFGAIITAFDKSPAEKIGPSIDELHALGVKTCLGENYLSELNGFNMIFKTPGMRFDLPELVAERERGAVVTSEMEVFFELCPAQIFAVTGSDGKTTTTTLIYRILKEEGYNCWLGGNIGTPLLDKVENISENDKVVLELSSFQLHTMKDSPDVAVITNISPNHLDVHKSYEEYIDAKRNIMLYQNKDGKYGPSKVILNLDNEVTKSMSGDAKGEVTFFSRREALEEGLFLKNGALISKKAGKETFIVNADDILIPGLHNVENYLAASAAVIDYVRPETIRKVAVSFPGVEHRIELVREISGVKFYN
ncbi:MAG TPA: UDP-N-acetylmuramoyl-L-alanine--D-glutamate ligase, partial [Clostridia bacterium]